MSAAPPRIGNRRLATILVASYLARVPVTAITLCLILVVRERGLAYDVAGLATGGYTLALSLTSPAIGRLADRHGAPRVFAVGAPVAAVALAAIGTGTAGGSTAATVALAAVAGAAIPPLGALTRGLLSPLLDGRRRARVLAVDATAQELCFIAGPLLLAGLVAVTTAAHALVVLAVLLVAGSFGYLVAARGTARAGEGCDGGGRSPLASAGLRAVLGVAVLAGAMFGAMELSITAAVDEAGRRDLAGVMLGVWSLGSLLGGLALVRWPVERPLGRLVAALAATLVAGVAIAAAAGSPHLLVALVLAHGAAQAPVMAVCYVIVPLVVAGRSTEAFAWLTSAVVGGIALGTAIGGASVDAGGAAAGFLAGAAAAGLAGVVALAPLRRALAAAHPPPGRGSPAVGG